MSDVNGIGSPADGDVPAPVPAPDPAPGVSPAPAPGDGARRRSRGQQIAVLAGAAVGVAAVSLGVVAVVAHQGHRPPLALPVAEASAASPQPLAGVTQEPADPSPSATADPVDTGAEQGNDSLDRAYYERTPLPDHLRALYDMPLEEFKQQPKEEQLKLWSWISQRQDDFDADYALVTGSKWAKDIVPVAETNTGQQLVNRVAAYDRMALTLFDPSDPTKRDLNEALKVVVATQHSGEDNSLYAGFMNQVTNMPVPSPRDETILTMAAEQTFENRASVITKTSKPYESDDGYTAIDVFFEDTDGDPLVSTYRIVPFIDYTGKPASAVTRETNLPH